MATRGAALVVGASGVTGTPLVEQLIASGWRVTAVSRRVPALRPGVPAAGMRHVAVDLADARATRHALAPLDDVTHVFYCANGPSADLRLAMLRSVLEAIEAAAPDLTNINLMQGTKYYGGHLGPFSVPARETDPRIPGSDFYYREEDLVRAWCEGRRWTWTALRPHAVCGYAAGNPLNLGVALAVYGSICRAIGDALPFPATAACFETLHNVMDADLLARAAIWCATAPGCANQAFNVNNGDVFRWRELWPLLAAFFDLVPAGPGGQALPQFFTAREAAWRALAERHRLRAFPYERLARWVQGDYRPPNSRLACEYDVIADLGKLRAHGFGESIGSGRMFTRLFARLRAERVIP